MITIKAVLSEKSIRVDRFLSEQFPEHARTFLKKLINSGKIAVNDKIIQKASTPIYNKDTITIESLDIPQRAIKKEALEPYKNFFKNHLLYEDKHFLVIDKPSNLIIHPSSPQNETVTFSDILIEHYPAIASVGEPDRPGIVHRLDKDTTGLLLVAKTAYGHEKLSELFKKRTIKKMYYAVVKGHPEKNGSIDLPIERHPVHKRKMTCRLFTGRTAKTDFEIIHYYDQYTFIKAYPHTGRTHQIRIHLASIKHPIIGDIVYGSQSKYIKRQALHAAELLFEFDGKKHHFTSSLAPDIKSLIQNKK